MVRLTVSYSESGRKKLTLKPSHSSKIKSLRKFLASKTFPHTSIHIPKNTTPSRYWGFAHDDSASHGMDDGKGYTDCPGEHRVLGKIKKYPRKNN